jgi:hypothetical protein
MPSNNGHTLDPLDGLLAGLSPDQRVAALGDLLQATKNGAVSVAEAQQIVSPSAGGDRSDRGAALKAATFKAAKELPPTRQESPSQTGSDGGPNGRDQASGRFTAGNKFSRGNPFSRRMAGFRQALVDAAADRLPAVFSKLLDLAVSGDMQAITLTLAYTIGKPQRAVDPDSLDLAEWRLADASPTLAEAMRAIFDSVAPAAATDAQARYLRQTFAERIQEKKGDGHLIEVLALKDRRCGRRHKASNPL